MVDVRLNGIRKAYDPARPVLDGIDLHIQAGELFFLLGPSGCGKTTLLRAIAGFVTPDAGTVHFGDEDVTRTPPERRGAAMVFQSYALWPHLSVYRNVAFGLDVRGVRGEERDRRVREALATVELTELMDRKPPSLSGGQQQRVALARAVVVRPRVLLLDEPLSNLDAKLRIQMRTGIRRICKEAQLTGIYVTHDQKEALTMADRIAILHQGRLQQVGSPRDIYRRPANRFVAEFIGEGNFLPATVCGPYDGGCVVESSLGQLTSATGGWAPGAKVTLLVRPESIVAATGPGPNAFQAVVAGGEFMGEVGQWRLAVGHDALSMYELQPQPRTLQEAAWFRVAEEDVVLLPDQTPDRSANGRM